MNQSEREEAIVGCLLGMAVGDALGLACEGMSPRRQSKCFPNLSHYHFLFGRGMASDDTEHACMTGQAVLASNGDAEAFSRSLRWRLRWWLLGLPAGIGRATLRAIVKLWLGGKEGVFSAGNGPAMRSPILGACFAEDQAHLRNLVTRSTRLTHTDPKAEYGAMAIAMATAASAQSPPGTVDIHAYLKDLQKELGEGARDFLDLVEMAHQSAQRQESATVFAESLGLRNGVTGYIYHTVPVVLQVWFRCGADYRKGVLEIIHAGGDSDTTAAILGGILGAAVDRNGIPSEWLQDLWEWPRSVSWMITLGRRLARSSDERQKPLFLFVPGLLLRNAIFFVLVLVHAFRRCLPPY